MKTTINPEIIKWRTWSGVRKTCVISAIIGATFTIGAQGYCLCSNSRAGLTAVDYCVGMLAVAAYIPASFIEAIFAEIFNLNMRVGMEYFSWVDMCLSVVVNVLLLGLIGGGIGLRNPTIIHVY